MSSLLALYQYKLAVVGMQEEQCIVLELVKELKESEEQERFVGDDQHCKESYFQFCLIVADLKN